MNPYQADIDAIVSHRYDQGGDFWTTPDKKLFKGAPFSALESPGFLLELGVLPEDPVLRGVADLFWEAWREDGRFKVYPKGQIFPCQTVLVAELLGNMGYTGDARLQKTYENLLSTRHTDGGWRCEKYYFGRGPETECANPLPTLVGLNALRLAGFANREPSLDTAVGFLLDHWDSKKPIGPCHYGIGTLFMQVEYPFRGYNLFYYVYVLSFYKRAQADKRFQAALAALEATLVDGQIVPERVVPKLAKLSFCTKRAPSALATRHYHEILANLGRAV